MTRIRLPLTALVVLLAGLLLSGCHVRRSLSNEERTRLDSLDAAAVVQAYFGSRDSATAWYLTSDRQQEAESGANVVPNRERESGVDDLVINAGYWASSDPDPEAVRNFTVEYVSRNRSSNGEPPGKRFYFVRVVREPAKTGPWRVDSVGTGP